MTKYLHSDNAQLNSFQKDVQNDIRRLSGSPLANARLIDGVALTTTPTVVRSGPVSGYIVVSNDASATVYNTSLSPLTLVASAACTVSLLVF